MAIDPEGRQMSATTRPPRWPTPAETARTLASGVAATLLLPEQAAARPPAPSARTTVETTVRARSYVGLSSGQIYVFADDHTEAGQRLHSALGGAGELDTPALLDVLDTPPVRTDLPRARLCVAGWVETLTPDEQRVAAVDAAAVHPSSRLLAVGHTATLYRLHPAELSLTRGDTTFDVDVEEFRSVEADPLYQDEHEVTDHLQRHHYDDLTQWALARLSAAERHTLRQVTLSGIDRYGLDLVCVTARGCRRERVSFAAAVPDVDALGEALRELSQCPCEPPVNP